MPSFEGSRPGFAGLLLLTFIGCGPLGQSGVEPIRVDPQAAAAEAMTLLDANTDGSLSDDELAGCPAIAGARQHYDQNSDGQISQAEVADHLQRMFYAGSSLREVQCTVTRGGRPLAGATVRFVPEAFLGEGLPTAVATTDASGLALPSLPGDQLPEQLKGASLMNVGVYRVEIEHPSMTGTGGKRFGFEVDPTRRDGSTARFDL